LPHDARRAASRACWTAGSNRPTSTPMMAITTSNSISVNACLGRFEIAAKTPERKSLFMRKPS
jgi:hypothetical protein